MKETSLKEIQNRRDFEDAFHAAMSGADQRLRQLWHFEKGQNLPKTYLVEFHPRTHKCEDHVWGTGEVYRSLKQSGPSFGFDVKKTKDDSLLFVKHIEKDHTAEFIVDCLNPRFLSFHTISNAESTDRFIFDRLTQYRPEFDLFWFPISLLEEIEKRERITGREAQFDPRLEFCDQKDESGEDPQTDVLTDEIESESSGVAPSSILRKPRLNFSFEFPEALQTYRWLKEQPNFLPDVPLNCVLAERDDDGFGAPARARIKSNGKITGKGSDFSNYLQIVNGTLDNYSLVVKRLEKDYWLRMDTNGDETESGLRILGEPFCIEFSQSFSPAILVDLLLDCKHPFRLTGLVDKVADDFFVVDAIDLHINHSLSFEIGPRFMRIYLHEGTCGNTLVRIIRSLQHHIDSNLSHPQLLS